MDSVSKEAVTQADREAAAENAFEGSLISFSIRQGDRDNHRLVQAFAAHRTRFQEKTVIRHIHYGPNGENPTSDQAKAAWQDFARFQEATRLAVVEEVVAIVMDRCPYRMLAREIAAAIRALQPKVAGQ